jgi:hypothetical protein
LTVSRSGACGAGFVVVRWGAAELADLEQLEARIRRGFARASRLRGAA